jgi:hypothetical protein
MSLWRSDRPHTTGKSLQPARRWRVRPTFQPLEDRTTPSLVAGDEPILVDIECPAPSDEVCLPAPGEEESCACWCVEEITDETIDDGAWEEWPEDELGYDEGGPGDGEPGFNDEFDEFDFKDGDEIYYTLAFSTTSVGAGEPAAEMETPLGDGPSAEETPSSTLDDLLLALFDVVGDKDAAPPSASALPPAAPPLAALEPAVPPQDEKFELASALFGVGGPAEPDMRHTAGWGDPEAPLVDAPPDLPVIDDSMKGATAARAPATKSVNVDDQDSEVDSAKVSAVGETDERQESDVVLRHRTQVGLASSRGNFAAGLLLWCLLLLAAWGSSGERGLLLAEEWSKRMRWLARPPELRRSTGKQKSRPRGLLFLVYPLHSGCFPIGQ